MPITLEQYWEDIPRLHSWDGGRTWNTGGFEKEHFSPLAKILRPGMRILETGCGNSTIFFLLHDPEILLTVDPSADIFQRVQKYSAANGIDQSNFAPSIAGSEIALPKLAERYPAFFDFILIDGDHGWPAVMVDFCYALRMLAPNACLMIDDVQLYSVGELARLLSGQPGFEKILDLEKSIVFRRNGDFNSMPGWTRQPYVVERSAPKKERKLFGLFR